MPTHTAFEGGCLCGAVRYRVAGPSVARSLCHCKTCRLAAGAPSVAWVVWRSSDFSWISGAPARYASSKDVERTFCGQCGTPLTYQKTSERGTIDVTTVTLDAADELAPTMEIWTDHRLPWECV